MPYLLQCYRALMRTTSIFPVPFVATKGVLCCFQSTRHTNNVNLYVTMWHRKIHKDLSGQQMTDSTQHEEPDDVLKMDDAFLRTML